MAYDLCAIVGIQRLFTDSLPLPVVALPQDLAMIPLTEESLKRIAALANVAEAPEWEITLPITVWLEENPQAAGSVEVPPFWSLTRSGLAWIVECSIHGSMAYIEDMCHGGDCMQCGAVWKAGRLILGPLMAELGYLSTEQNRLAGPVNQVLRELGVDRGTHADEFVALNLGRHRRTEEWLPSVNRDPQL